MEQEEGSEGPEQNILLNATTSPPAEEVVSQNGHIQNASPTTEEVAQPESQLVEPEQQEPPAPPAQPEPAPPAQPEPAAPAQPEPAPPAQPEPEQPEQSEPHTTTIQNSTSELPVLYEKPEQDVFIRSLMPITQGKYMQKLLGNISIYVNKIDDNFLTLCTSILNIFSFVAHLHNTNPDYVNTFIKDLKEKLDEKVKEIKNKGISDFQNKTSRTDTQISHISTQIQKRQKLFERFLPFLKRLEFMFSTIFGSFIFDIQNVLNVFDGPQISVNENGLQMGDSSIPFVTCKSLVMNVVQPMCLFYIKNPQKNITLIQNIIGIAMRTKSTRRVYMKKIVKPTKTTKPIAKSKPIQKSKVSNNTQTTKTIKSKTKPKSIQKPKASKTTKLKSVQKTKTIKPTQTTKSKTKPIQKSKVSKNTQTTKTAKPKSIQKPKASKTTKPKSIQKTKTTKPTQTTKSKTKLIQKPKVSKTTKPKVQKVNKVNKVQKVGKVKNRKMYVGARGGLYYCKIRDGKKVKVYVR